MIDIERQQLPNSTLILVLGILSLIGCCCYGIIGMILGIVAVILANQATKTYYANPEIYIGYQNVKAGKIMGIIGIVLGTVALIAFIVAWFALGGMQGILEMQQRMNESYGS
ncbi:MAG: CCC motif membrane protein [Gillisia sp.]